MQFPVSYSKQIIFNNVALTEKEILLNFEKSLRALKANRIRIKDNAISFAGGMFRWVDKKNLLVPISRGQIRISQYNNTTEVQFDINFVESLVVIAFMALVIPPITLLDDGPKMADLILIPFVSGVMWLWVFGMNYYIAIRRFKSFIRDDVLNCNNGVRS